MQDEIKRLLSSAEPEPDESFIGYLFRLKDRNDYDTLTWVLQLGEIGEFAKNGFHFCFNPTLNLSPLSQLTGISKSKLSALPYYPAGPISRGIGNYLFFGQVVSSYIIRVEHQKICTVCLKASGYARKIWELTPVTSCPLHKCLLLDECPKCRKRISWSRQELSLCKCGFDWRVHKSQPVEDRELAVTRQIYRLCNLSISPKADQAKAISGSPLYKLGLQDFLSALFLIGSQYEGFVDTKGSRIGPSKRNMEVHRILCKSLTAFEDWPESFYSFLDHLRADAQNSKRNWGIQRDFDKFDCALYTRLTSGKLDFMRTAFEDYLIHRWDGGCASHIARIRKAAQQNSKYMPREEAKTILGIGNELIDVYLSRGKLRGIVREQDGFRNYLIERSSVVELRRELDEALYLKQVASVLGLYPRRVLELVEAGLLDLISGPELDGYGDWLFSGQSVAGLLEKLKKKIITLSRARTKKKMVSLDTAIKRLAHVGVRLPQFITAMLDGTVAPCAENKKLKGLRRLLFPELELSDYIWSRMRESVKDGFLVSELHDILGLTRNAAYSLVRKGILPARQKTEDPSPKLFVTKEDLNSFVASHVVLSKIATKLKTDAGFLARLLMKKGLQPVSGQIIDGGQRYIFKKSDLESVNLARLVAAARKRSALKRKEPQTIGLDDAAKILDIDVETLRQLVENGILKTYRNVTRKKGSDEMIFSTPTIMNYRGRIKDYIGLVTYKVAAKMTGLSVYGLWVTYVQKGRLHAINPKGKPKPLYLQKEDVEALAAIRQQAITSPEVAMRLRVNITCVHKLKLAGILKPVSGPDVDGFRLDLYLRSDVEKLHAEREVFKAKRVKEGGTTRFGRQAGPKNSPVKNVIGPRIDQLIEEWQQETPNNRITGQRLYQQLIDEGYQLGIVTVYEYLRQKSRIAA